MSPTMLVTKHYNVAETAALIGRSERAVRKLIERKQGPAFKKVHGRLIVSADDLNAWLNEA